MPDSLKLKRSKQKLYSFYFLLAAHKHSLNREKGNERSGGSERLNCLTAVFDTVTRRDVNFCYPDRVTQTRPEFSAPPEFSSGKNFAHRSGANLRFLDFQLDTLPTCASASSY